MHYTRQKSRLAPLAALILLTIPPPAYGRTIADTDDPVTESTETILHYIPDSGLGLPATLPSDRDVYVLLTASGAYTRIKVLGRPGTSPSRLADVLDASLKRSTEVTYATGSAYVGADTATSRARGRMWQRQAVAEVPVASVMAAFTKAQFTPHLLLRIRRSAHLEDASPARYSRGRYNWYGAEDLAPGRPVHVRTVLPMWQLLAFILMIVLPISTTFLLIAERFHGWWLRRSEGSMMAQMEVGNRYGCITLLLIVAGLPALWAVNITGMERVSALWFGEPLALQAFGLMVVPMLLSAMLLTANGSRHLTTAGLLLDPAAHPLTPEDIARAKRQKWVSRAMAAIGLILVFGRSFVLPIGSARSVCLIVGMILFVARDTIAGLLVRGVGRLGSKAE